MSTADGTVIGTTKIVDHGADNTRWNLVILSDGYQVFQLGQFASDAQNFVNALFAARPFDELQGVINVHRIDVASNQSGADDPPTCGGTGATAATYFDASFCNNGLRRLLVVNDGTVIDLANAQVPRWHMALVLVNSTVFGGSGGPVAVASLAPGSADIAIHEMGHTAFGLADEYSFYVGCGAETDHDHHPPGEPSEPNVTRESNRFFIKWRHLIESTTPVPTKSNPDCTQCDNSVSPVPAGTIGAFEGAKYYHCGAYRPEYDCRMRNSGSQFCAVCQQVVRNRLARFVLPGNVRGTPGFAFRSDVGRGTLEIVTPMASGGFGHYWRNSNAPGMPWHGPFIFGTDVGQFDDIALNMVRTMEVVARAGGQLIYYWREDAPTFAWHGPFPLGNQIVSGNPCLITGIYNLGALLTNELVVPVASGGIAHYWRDARNQARIWNGPAIFGTSMGNFDAVALIQSSFGDPGNGNMPTNLELVARQGDQLYHYWRDAGPGFHWNGPFPFGQRGVAGNPSFVQGPFGIYKKNFELVVPLSSGGIGHYWRDNGASGLPWHGPFVFGADVGRFEALDMLFDSYTRWHTPPHTMQVVTRFQNQLLYYYREPGPPFRWALL
jgi:hypothetical protein